MIVFEIAGIIIGLIALMWTPRILYLLITGILEMINGPSDEPFNQAPGAIDP